MEFETKAIHVGEEPDLERGSGDVVVPIHLSSTFARKKVNYPTQGYEYSRTGNPTRDALEKRLAALEDAAFGLAFASGMAAESTLAITLLHAGDHVLAFDDLYGGTRRLFNHILDPHFKVETTYVDARDPRRVQEAIRSNTRLIWLESPTNPLMKICDLAAISKIAKEVNIPVVVDNTFLSPYFQKPLRLGATVVVHSSTKYLNGHSDSVGGAVMLSDEDLYRQLKFNQNAMGAILSPFDSFLVLRGIKTLAVRMREHQQNALRLASYLEKHPKVERVNYPGLKSHPQHALAERQATGHGGMLSFEINGGLKEAERFLENVKLFALAESLGGVESLIEHPALMTHASVPKEIREQSGLTDSLIRVSVGIEHIDDLIADFDRAFQKIS
ncbi:MAG TPA: PLP-dependent aspartate aminotransferase family protein [Thermodesulfobacteriota bacterium]|nr:PLP-dependent aspartate aminotransferase family protein [Thermodesulfobacteriota bacterium]